MTTDRVLTFDAFATYLSDGLELDVDVLHRDIRLTEDLGLDSFDFMELVVLVEELGVHFPDHIVVSIETIGDLYEAFSLRAARQGTLPDSEGRSTLTSDGS